MNRTTRFALSIALVGALFPSVSNARPWDYGGHLYDVGYVPNGISWEAAQAAAVVSGGNLVTISSAEENDFVYSLISNRPELWFIDGAGNGQGPFIGLYQPNNVGDFVWVSGEPVTYTNWAPGEPNNNLNGESVAQFFAQGTLIGNHWNDVAPAPYASVRGYIVEIVPEPAVAGLLLPALITLRSRHR